VAIVKGVNPSLDSEAIRVVSSLPKFEKPAKKNGETVSVQFMVPITFALK
jgi:protein TonB